MRLRNRFALFFVAFAVAISTIQGSMSYYASRAALQAELDRRLVDVAGAVGVALEDDETLLLLRPGDEGTPEWDYLHLLLLKLRNAGYVRRADIFSWTPEHPTASVLVGVTPSDQVAIGQELNWAPIESTTIAAAYENGSATSDLAYPLASEPDGPLYKRGIVRLGSSEFFLGVLMPVDHLEPLSALGWSILALTMAAGILAALAGWRLARGIASRLEVLSRGALRIQRGAMDRPFDLEGEDEIGQLARAMDRMRARIRHRDEQLRLMLSRVAHEIRNPLGGLELFAAAAQDTEDRAERHRILERVRQEVRGLNTVITEFLGFARPGRTEPQLHDVREPLREAVALAEAEVKKRGGTLHIDFPPKPLLAIADPMQVKRLVLNLLRNASHAGDRVWLEGAMVNGEVRLSIRDDGPGVPRDLRDRIFEPFVGNKAQGAGLGLAIVKEMVEANHGRVELLPQGGDGGEGGGGAEFHVYLSGPEDLPGDSAQRLGGQEGMAT